MIPIDTGGITQFATGMLEQSPMLHIEYVLHDKVDKKTLQQATVEALDVFSLFNVRLTYDASSQKLFYERNNREPEVYPYDGTSHLLGEESNGYLFRVYYDENRVILSMHHMLTDFTGADNFLKCILCCYYSVDYRSSLTVDPKDERDPYELYGDSSGAGFSMKGKWINEVEIPSTMAFRRGESCKVHTLSFSVPDLLKISKRAESSVFPLMSWMVAKAIAEVYGTPDKMIMGSGAFNCRQLYNAKTPKGFSHAFPVVLHPKENAMDVNLQLTIQRARMDLELDEETVAGEIAARKEIADVRVKDIAAYVRDQESLDIKRHVDMNKTSFFNSYAGVIRLGPELAPHVAGFEFLGAPTRNPILITSWSWDNALYCNVDEVGCEKSIAHSIIDIAQQYGAAGLINDVREFCFDYYPMEELFND